MLRMEVFLVNSGDRLCENFPVTQNFGQRTAARSTGSSQKLVSNLPAELLSSGCIRGEQGKQGARDVVPGKQQREGWIMSYEKGPTKTKKHRVLVKSVGVQRERGGPGSELSMAPECKEPKQCLHTKGNDTLRTSGEQFLQREDKYLRISFAKTEDL
ncbi:hypothetical protein Y1Q_0023843 [Alligator mississippiensis]|uniref:Uncharacterized protein n=1 Tax=Alligator mississippiensis TaxID=8496 RepID=A0A151MKF0_ALLMI|nr:hypothetical protein Y1Q_0023843 [Alligator mississippiensis]